MQNAKRKTRPHAFPGARRGRLYDRRGVVAAASGGEGTVRCRHGSGQGAFEDDDSFESIYRGHVGEVYRFSLSRLRNPHDAEDVTQSTFLNAFQALRAGHQPLHLRGWLMAVAGNICRDRHRAALRRPMLVALRDLPNVPAAERDVSGMRELVDGLNGLPEQQRVALVRHELGGLPFAEVARELGTTETHIAGLIVKARKNLREQMTAGMSCERATALSKRGRHELSARDRRTMDAHRAYCTACEPGPLRAAAGAIIAVVPFLWRFVRGSTRTKSGATSLGVKSAGGVGATVAGKVVVVAGVVAISGGAVYEARTLALPAEHSPPRPAVAHTTSATSPARATVSPRAAKLAGHPVLLHRSSHAPAAATPAAHAAPVKVAAVVVAERHTAAPPRAVAPARPRGRGARRVGPQPEPPPGPQPEPAPGSFAPPPPLPPPAAAGPEPAATGRAAAATASGRCRHPVRRRRP